ncbi:MAG: hypothetical protein WDW36_004396 [Sanguina aurantia]
MLLPHCSVRLHLPPRRARSSSPETETPSFPPCAVTLPHTGVCVRLHLSSSTCAELTSNQDTIIELICRHMPRLQVLELPDAVVVDSGMEALQKMTSIRQIQLADIDLHDIPQPGAIAWWRSLRLGRVLLYHLPNFLPVAYMHTFIAEVNIVSWLCPPGQDILRVIDYVVSSLSAVEHVELRVSADLSWAPILERLGELRGLRSLQLSPCFSRMNDDVELPSGQHLAAICARMKSC